MQYYHKFISFYLQKKKEYPKIINALSSTFFLLTGIGLIFSLWWIISISTSSVVVPGPLESLRTAFKVLGETNTYLSYFASLWRIILSLIISGILAVICGVLSGLFLPLEKISKPLITTLRALPIAAIILVLLIYTKYSSYIVVCLITFPLIYETTLKGIKETRAHYAYILKIDGDRNVRNIIKILLPLASPHIFLGLIQSFGLSLKVEIMAEIMTGSSQGYKGIGVLINNAYQNFEMDLVFAYTLIAIVVIAAIDFSFTSLKKLIKDKND